MITLKHYLSAPLPPHTGGSIVHWWEARRLYYNVIVFLEYVIAVAATVVMHPPEGSLWPGWSAIGALLLMSLAFVLPANIWYTGAWIAEWVLRIIWPRLPSRFSPWMLSIGIIFSFIFIWFIVAAMTGSIQI
jgi:hypothetical protein